MNLSGDQHDYLAVWNGILASAPVNSVKRTAVTLPVDRVSNFARDSSHEEWQSRLRTLQQCICELLIKNQQLRWALIEMKELAPGKMKTSMYEDQKQPESLTSGQLFFVFAVTS
jgi:hypothetical protein